MIELIIGIFIGATFGAFIMAIMAASGQAEKQAVTGENKNA